VGRPKRFKAAIQEQRVENERKECGMRGAKKKANLEAKECGMHIETEVSCRKKEFNE
jgi:hypothetical protein